ncbi:prepilin-type N-terminal cleavage/methylation domain-containing protein [Marinagarivorans cellulosilyticus]|uniref:MSHA biogenesis protein MshO n=1 Tax=Marinagarivorans cellulosilyticus TaxID=2721545 RepID=A0AAN1WIM1_9GAMM|nr:prepilin-type N-terminal cleavage/methylation domain-containing protein [Marinagarivorans cellulosilyticus]BCD98247.1 MSHA biogenesis protein MshO [Marinagarivorans cellulosilyticus]
MFRSVQQDNGGFTLVELIAVIVVLAITSVVGGGFVVSVVDQYQKAQLRSTLVQRGTVTMEQLARQLRMSVPNSLRVSTGGDCVEFMPLIGGAFYTEELPDAENNKAVVDSVDTVEFSLLDGTPSQILVAPLDSTEIYTVAVPSARIAAGDFGVAPYSQAVFSGNHRFLRNSSSRRLLLAEQPKRFCIVGSQLIRYEGYGLDTGGISSASPGGTSVLMSASLEAEGSAFVLTSGSEDRNAALLISLRFADRGESVLLNSRVLVRNAP